MEGSDWVEFKFSFTLTDQDAKNLDDDLYDLESDLIAWTDNEADVSITYDTFLVSKIVDVGETYRITVELEFRHQMPLMYLEELDEFVYNRIQDYGYPEPHEFEREFI